jgi:hypothetical protein
MTRPIEKLELGDRFYAVSDAGVPNNVGAFRELARRDAEELFGEFIKAAKKKAAAHEKARLRRRRARRAG